MSAYDDEAKPNQTTIYDKLSAVQAALKAPKGQYNPHGNFRYRSCENILEAVKPLLKDARLVLTIHDDIITKGDRYYVEATATLFDIDTKESISNTAYAREELERKGMCAAQLTGSSSSYARKYALNGLFAIDDSKQDAVLDPDTPAFTETASTPPESERPITYTNPPPRTPPRPSQSVSEGNADIIAGATYHCAGCGAEVPEATVKYCKMNQARFNGRVLCYTCQRK